MTALIETHGLHYRYPPATHAAAADTGQTLRFADIRLLAGEHLLLRGKSGSGKSTLLALLAGLLSPSGGQVSIAGTDLQSLSLRRRDAWRGECLGFVPQRLHLSSALTVLDNVMLPFLCAGLPPDAERATGLLERLGLQGLSGRKPHQLSVGQAQRVALSRALVRRPRILLADEPSASLDDEHAAQMMALLMQVASESGASLLVATHDARLLVQAQEAGGFQTLDLGASA
nr:ATP-binding cassette domain-containing protein [uncultured Roseateles sp.]